MAVNKIKFFWNHGKREVFMCHRFYQKAQLRNSTSHNYCSNKNISPTIASNEIKVKQKLQPIPKKNRKLSVIDGKDKELVESLKEGKNPFYPYADMYDKLISVVSDGCKDISHKVVDFCTGIKLNFPKKPFYPSQMDIVIIGCNPIGLSTAVAMKLKCPETPNILIIDKDNNFPHTSTNIGQSMLMQQLFIDEEEIAMNKYAVEFLSSFPRLTTIENEIKFKLPFEPLGSLLLADETNADELLEKIEVLKRHNIATKILDKKALKRKFPWLKLNNVLFGSLGMNNEGMYDPWSFLIGLRCKAINLGVQFMTAEVLDFGIDSFGVPRRMVCKLPDGSFHRIEFAVTVLACGIEALNFVEIFNSSNLGPLMIKLPLEERMRYEYCFYSPKGPGLDTPIVVDTDGIYFRREGLCNYYVAGVPCVPHSEDEILEPYSVFVNKVKPFLAKRVPQFDQIDLVKGWIDSYDFCISNKVGIIGPHPNEPGIIFALGFSHLGLQYAPAVGRAVMEYIVYDEYKAIDLTRYQIENLWQKQHLKAKRKQKKLLEPNERIAISD